MLYKLWTFIQLLLPYFIVIRLYKFKKALPFNIRTRNGINLKAIMITQNYGILFTDKDYIANRVKYLKQRQDDVNRVNRQIASEMNELSTEARELFFNEQN